MSGSSLELKPTTCLPLPQHLPGTQLGSQLELRVRPGRGPHPSPTVLQPPRQQGCFTELTQGFKERAAPIKELSRMCDSQLVLNACYHLPQIIPVMAMPILSFSQQRLAQGPTYLVQLWELETCREPDRPNPCPQGITS